MRHRNAHVARSLIVSGLSETWFDLVTDTMLQLGGVFIPDRKCHLLVPVLSRACGAAIKTEQTTNPTTGFHMPAGQLF